MLAYHNEQLSSKFLILPLFVGFSTPKREIPMREDGSDEDGGGDDG